MYEELVKRLREAIPWECPLTCKNTMHEAADATEVLNGRYFMKKKVAEWLAERAPKWVPVTERLPDEYVSVLCYCSRNDQYGCGEWRKEDNGTIYWAGLYGMMPTHWMPLPAAPSEINDPTSDLNAEVM